MPQQSIDPSLRKAIIGDEQVCDVAVDLLSPDGRLHGAVKTIHDMRIEVTLSGTDGVLRQLGLTQGESWSGAEVREASEMPGDVLRFAMRRPEAA